MNPRPKRWQRFALPLSYSRLNYRKYYCIKPFKGQHFYITLSIGLGCQIKYAKDFVYTDALNLNDKNTEMPIGVNCRTCDRMDCQQRAFPPLHKKFDIDLNKRGISVYVAD